MDDLMKQVKENKQEFIEQVNAEFGGKEEWEVKKDLISSQTGADRVYVQKDIMATKMCQEGYIYRVSIGRTRFTAVLEPKDVGLDADNPEHKAFIDHYLSLGNKNLLPTEQLRQMDRIDRQIRRTIDEQYGIPTVAGSFVPMKNVPPMMERLEELKGEYFAVRDKIVDEYDYLRADTEAAYQRFAVEVFKTIRKDQYYEPTLSEVEQFVRSTMAKFPNRDQIKASFYVTIDVGVVETTEFMMAQQSRLTLIKEREDIYRRELKLVEQKLTEAVRMQNIREQNQVALEKKQLETKIFEEEKKRRVIEEIVEQKKAAYMPQMEQLFADLSGAVHGIVFDALQKVNSALMTNGSLRAADTRTLRSIISKVQNLSISDDPELENWVQQIEDIINTPSIRRDDAEVKQVLSEIRKEAARAIVSLGCVPRTIRDSYDMMDIEVVLDEPDGVPVRQTRAISGGNQQTIFDFLDGGADRFLRAV